MKKRKSNLTNAFVNCKERVAAFKIHLFLMLAGSSNAHADVTQWFGNIQKTYNPALQAITGGFFIAGAFFLWSSISMARERTQNPGQIKVSTILITALCGVAAIGFAYFGGGLVKQVFGGSGVGGTSGFTSFQ